MIKNLPLELRDYLQRVLGIDVHLKDEVAAGVPFYLLDRYVLRTAEILGKPCVLIMARESEAPSPAILRKDSQRIQEILDRVPIWVSLRIDAVDRQRLIQRRLPFVLPGFQAYLPDLLIDAREHFQRLRASQRPDRLTPSAQRVLLDAFYRRIREVDQLMGPAHDGHYSPMTRSRVISELEAVGLAETQQQGRNRHALIYVPWEAFWEKAHPLLGSPVRRRVYLIDDEVAKTEHLPKAGLSALAEMSMLTSPRLPVFAAVPRLSAGGSAKWRQFVTERVDDARAELELWAYPPLAEKQPAAVVDRLSLYLSLEKEEDSRTQETLQQLLKAAL
jgi:hypothetical protein